MSDKTLKVMKDHLKIVEKYIEDLKEAEGKKAAINAINKCSKAIQDQYPDLEEIADDFTERFSKDKELSDISKKVADILSVEVTKLYGKIGQYMADADFMEAFANFDIVVGNNPLFGVNEFGADVAADVSKAIAGELDGLATKILSETVETDESTIVDIIKIMNDFLDISKKYVAKMQVADTSRKVVTATDAFVSAIKKQIPDMKANTDQLKLIMARPVKPEGITKAADELKKTLGDDLKEVMKDKNELLQEHKVQKSVGKLGAMLSEVPF